MTTLYRLLTGSDDAAFCHKITKALNEGWELHGSPTMSFDTANGKAICGQAVTKKTDQDYDPDRPLSDQ